MSRHWNNLFCLYYRRDLPIIQLKNQLNEKAEALMLSTSDDSGKQMHEGSLTTLLLVHERWRARKLQKHSRTVH